MRCYERYKTVHDISNCRISRFGFLECSVEESIRTSVAARALESSDSINTDNICHVNVLFSVVSAQIRFLVVDNSRIQQRGSCLCRPWLVRSAADQAASP